MQGYSDIHYMFLQSDKNLRNFLFLIILNSCSLIALNWYIITFISISPHYENWLLIKKKIMGKCFTLIKRQLQDYLSYNITVCNTLQEDMIAYLDFSAHINSLRRCRISTLYLFKYHNEQRIAIIIIRVCIHVFYAKFYFLNL